MTLAVLASVNSTLSDGEELNQKELLKSKFDNYFQKTKEINFSDTENRQNWTNVVSDFLD